MGSEQYLVPDEYVDEGNRRACQRAAVQRRAVDDLQLFRQWNGGNGLRIRTAKQRVRHVSKRNDDFQRESGYRLDFPWRDAAVCESLMKSLSGLFSFPCKKKRAGLIMKSKKEPIMFNDGSDFYRDKNSL